MSSPTWLIQHSNRSEGTSNRKVADACASLHVRYIEVLKVPFSLEFPDLSLIGEAAEGPFIVHGQTSFLLAAMASPYGNGVFFDQEKFRPTEYVSQLGDLMLNADQQAMRLGDLADAMAPEDRLFVRPNDDFKAFSGALMTGAAVHEWRDTIRAYTESGDELTEDTIVVAAPPKEIGEEWRAVIVDSKPVSIHSQHGCDHVTEELRALIEQAAAAWTPAGVVVLDAAETPDGFKLTEFNCFHASGFYQEDLRPVVSAVTAYVMATQAPT
jgi:hypothetical protein